MALSKAEDFIPLGGGDDFISLDAGGEAPRVKIRHEERITSLRDTRPRSSASGKFSKQATDSKPAKPAKSVKRKAPGKSELQSDPLFPKLPKAPSGKPNGNSTGNPNHIPTGPSDANNSEPAGPTKRPSKKRNKKEKLDPHDPLRFAIQKSGNGILFPSQRQLAAGLINPTPSGPIIEGSDPPRRQWVIKDFYPFVTGNEYSQRRAQRLGKTIRRSPRSIHQEARALMQQQLTKEALDRGEPAPNFHILTRRELREEKKAKKKDPAYRALKLERKKIQQREQRKRNHAVKALEEEGKWREAEELKRAPLFIPKPEQMLVAANGDGGGEERYRNGNAEMHDEDIEDGSSDEDDEGDLTDDLPEYDKLAQEQARKAEEAKKDEEKRARRLEEKERKAEEKRAKRALTKRQKTEARYNSMPTAPPPVADVPDVNAPPREVYDPVSKKRMTIQQLTDRMRNAGLSPEEQQAYMHRISVNQKEETNIKQSRRAAIRRDRKTREERQAEKKRMKKLRRAKAEHGINE